MIRIKLAYLFVLAEMEGETSLDICPGLFLAASGKAKSSLLSLILFQIKIILRLHIIACFTVTYSGVLQCAFSFFVIINIFTISSSLEHIQDAVYHLLVWERECTGW